MEANTVAAHEIDGWRSVLDGLVGGAAAQDGALADMGTVRVPGELPLLSTERYGRAILLLSLYRSRVDFLAASRLP